MISTWIPVKITGKDGGHVHGLVYWLWDRPFSDKTLPQGVEIVGLGPADKECDLCQRWGAPDWSATPRRPISAGPEDVEDHRCDLFSDLEGPQSPVETNEVDQTEEKPAKPADFSDF